MDLHQQRGSRADGFVVILQMRAVRRADFAQPGARAAHDVGNAKRAADLDEFAARHDHFLLRRQRRQHEQHRRRVVVDDGGGFGAGEFADEFVDQVVAVAAACRSRDRIRGSPGACSASTTACTASSGSSARPRFVWSTVPVRLKTLRNPAAFALRERRAHRLHAAGLRRVLRPGARPACASRASRRACGAMRRAPACGRTRRRAAPIPPTPSPARPMAPAPSATAIRYRLLRSLDIPRFVHTRCERLFQVLMFRRPVPARATDAATRAGNLPRPSAGRA